MTPAALPQGARRRRIDPARSRTDAKGGDERVSERARAALAVAQALRHAEVRARASHIRLQREPFEAKGDRAEGFARDARFAKERLWHVEITFDEPVGGPLVIGDGRFLGLGVMAPVPKAEGLQLLLVESGLVGNADPVHIAHALRRAVMARVQGILGDARPLPPFFGGHERDGSPARTESHPHLAFAFDPGFSRLLVAAPHVLDRRAPTREERGHLEVLEKALQGFRELRAGRAGCLTLRRVPLFADADALTAPSRVWSSVTPYQVTRHAKRIRAEEVLAMDVRSECRRYGLPEPCAIEPLALRGVSGVGLVGSVKLIFAVAVEGPLLLGRSRHIGGGLFLGGAFRTG
jgi:CRISPR-associated protein Csb2